MANIETICSIGKTGSKRTCGRAAFPLGSPSGADVDHGREGPARRAAKIVSRQLPVPKKQRAQCHQLDRPICSSLAKSWASHNSLPKTEGEHCSGASEEPGRTPCKFGLPVGSVDSAERDRALFLDRFDSEIGRYGFKFDMLDQTLVDVIVVSHVPCNGFQQIVVIAADPMEIDHVRN